MRFIYAVSECGMSAVSRLLSDRMVVVNRCSCLWWLPRQLPAFRSCTSRPPVEKLVVLVVFFFFCLRPLMLVSLAAAAASCCWLGCAAQWWVLGSHTGEGSGGGGDARHFRVEHGE